MPSTTSEYRRKLYGWLSYAFASEVFVIVSLTLFLPICLEQFARDNGFLLPEKEVPCSGFKSDVQEPVRCVVKIGWAWIDTASFSLYTYSVSVALQALVVISLGSIADHPPHRKPLLLSFAALGSVAASLFLFLPSSSPLWYLSSVLAIAANVGFGVSIVAMNSYLPALAQESPDIALMRQELENYDTLHVVTDREDDDIATENHSTPLLSGYRQASLEHRRDLELRYQTVLARETSRISSLGIALGYGSGILLLALTLLPVNQLHGSTFALRLAIGLSGIWWFIFSIPAAILLPSPPSSPEVDGLNQKNWSFTQEILRSWIGLVNNLRWGEVKKLRNTFKFLAAWFLLSDGLTTITSTAVLFGKTTLQMSPSALIVVGVLTPLSGIVGSLLWPIIQRKCQWSSLRVLVTLVVMASLLPAYGCLGFIIPARFGFGGLTTKGEMFALAMYFGSIYGAFQAYARAFYAKLLPPGQEARWYGLYSITDKSSSFIGPLVVGLISDLTGNIRFAFFFLVILIWAAVPLLMNIDSDRGWKDAQDYQFHSINIPPDE